MNSQMIVLGAAWALSIFYVFAWHKLPRLVAIRPLLINLVVSGLLLAAFYRMPHCSTLFTNGCLIMFVALTVVLCNFWAAAAMLLLRLFQLAGKRFKAARR